MSGAKRFLLTGAIALAACQIAAGANQTEQADQMAPEAAEQQPAEVKVSGAGWFKNRELRETLELLVPEDEPLLRIDAAFVEDAVVLLNSALEQEGFLRSSGVAIVRSNGEEIGRYPWEPGELPTPPRDLDGSAVEFELEPGVRYHFETLEFTGLTAFSPDEARSFFVEEGFLLEAGSSKRFTPAILRRGVSNLREQLTRMGYADATVEAVHEERDRESGAVDVRIGVEEGPMHRVGTVEAPPDLPEEIAAEVNAIAADATGAPWSRVWQQDFLLAVRSAGYAKGFATIEASLSEPEETRSSLGEEVNYELHVEAGPQVRVGNIRFEGTEVGESVLQRAVSLEPGSLFVRSEVDDDRLGLGALGVFSSVRTRVNERRPDLWDLTFLLTPNDRLEASILAGYGSYEQFRVGLEVFHSNLFRRAHRGRLQLIQSMKSTSGDYLYSVPQVFGTVTDLSVRLFGLQREEVSFDREEFGSSIGLRRHIEPIQADAAVRYQFESVSADITGDLAPDEDVPTDSRVASLTFDLTRDRRDNPLTPREGMHLSLTLEAAARAIGGEVDYQRLDFRGSWHQEIGRGRWLHVGWTHELLSRLGAGGREIPLARRIFPGGESSLRGYREGRASPRNEEGLVIGAEVSTVIHLEFEQALTQSLSAVAFVDAGLTAVRLESWPGDQVRVSAGLGLRYNTIIGPARLEYGHNVVKETGDQIGELHFALGFPF